jgi:hypothetical protein
MSVSSEGDPGYRPRHRPPAWLAVERPTPAQAAAAYRALRKSREDNKDEPGAADFYYGEMEMRRHANAGDPPGTPAGAPQHRTSGCHRVRHLVALLADRRLPAALAGVIGLVGVGFSRVGFHHPQPSQAVSWLYAL